MAVSCCGKNHTEAHSGPIFGIADEFCVVADPTGDSRADESFIVAVEQEPTRTKAFKLRPYWVNVTRIDPFNSLVVGGRRIIGFQDTPFYTTSIPNEAQIRLY